MRRDPGWRERRRGGEGFDYRVREQIHFMGEQPIDRLVIPPRLSIACLMLPSAWKEPLRRGITNTLTGTYGGAMKAISEGTLALAVVVAVFAGTACASRPTGYVDANGTFNAPYGYSVTPMGDDEFSVLVRANSVTPSERVAQIALLRAAHLTLEKGGNQFNIIHSESLVHQYQTVESVVVFGGLIPVGTSTAEDKLAALVIHVSIAGAAPVAPDALDAHQVVANLGARLQH